MKVKLDRVVFSSLHEAYKNYSVQETSFVISGSIPNGGKKFSSVVSYSRTGTRADVYIRKQGSSYARLMNAATRNVDYTGATTATNIIEYGALTIEVGAYIANFGSSYTAPTETYDVAIVAYDAPIS